jgi:hypothetical protein
LDVLLYVMGNENELPSGMMPKIVGGTVVLPDDLLLLLMSSSTLVESTAATSRARLRLIETSSVSSSPGTLRRVSVMALSSDVGHVMLMLEHCGGRLLGLVMLNAKV